MKKLVIFALVLLLVLPGAGLAENQPVTLKRFDDRFNESMASVYDVLGVPFAHQPPLTAKTDGLDELFTFSYQSSHILIQGNAYADTGVISSIFLKLKEGGDKELLEGIKAIVFFYALDPFEGTYVEFQNNGPEKTTKAIEAAKNEPVVYNGFSMTTIDLKGKDGWKREIRLEWMGGNPEAGTFSEALSFEEYQAYFAEK